MPGVCAALATGEQHPLLTLIAEHSVALVAMIRAMTTDVANPPADRGPRPGSLRWWRTGGGKAQTGRTRADTSTSR